MQLQYKTGAVIFCFFNLLSNKVKVWNTFCSFLRQQLLFHIVFESDFEGGRAVYKRRICGSVITINGIQQQDIFFMLFSFKKIIQILQGCTDGSQKQTRRVSCLSTLILNALKIGFQNLNPVIPGTTSLKPLDESTPLLRSLTMFKLWTVRPNRRLLL